MNMVPSMAGGQSSLSKSNSNTRSLRQPVKCSRCLDLGHSRRFCTSKVRCVRCYALGHIKRRCPSLSRPKPVWEWRPKALSTQVKPHLMWRPKVPLQSHLIKESRKILPTLDRVPSSRAEIADSPTSLSREQEQQNLLSHTHPLPNGEPHPEHPPVVLGHNPLEPNWQNEHQATLGNLGFFGANPHPNPMQQAHHNQH